MGKAKGTQREPKLDSIELGQDHMVDHPSGGGYYALWNGPALLDIGTPPEGFVRFAVATLNKKWTLLSDAKGALLPVAARYEGQRLFVCWLPVDAPPAPPAAQSRGGMSDADYAAALQNISSTRYQGMMDAAWGIGGWSTHHG